jgi:deoxycytidylate deaminase
MTSNKDSKFVGLAFDEATKSPCLMKHGAVVVANGKIMATGFNNYRCQAKDGFLKGQCSCHAEMDCLRKMYYRSKLTHKSKRKVVQSLQ